MWSHNTVFYTHICKQFICCEQNPQTESNIWAQSRFDKSNIYAQTRFDNKFQPDLLYGCQQNKWRQYGVHDVTIAIITLLFISGRSQSQSLRYWQYVFNLLIWCLEFPFSSWTHIANISQGGSEKPTWCNKNPRFIVCGIRNNISKTKCIFSKKYNFTITSTIFTKKSNVQGVSLRLN